jgi:hypothetical protein
MEWYEGRPQLKLTGYRSADEVDSVFDSCTVDVAYVVEKATDAIFIVADDPEWPLDQADYEWLCSIVKETLATNGITGIELSLVPIMNRE